MPATGACTERLRQRHLLPRLETVDVDGSPDFAFDASNLYDVHGRDGAHVLLSVQRLRSRGLRELLRLQRMRLHV